MYKETLRLFNAVQVDDKKVKNISEGVMQSTIRNGYVLSPTIQPNNKMLSIINQVVGISGEKANASFHKSWKIIQDTPMEVLVIQQIMHYFTTYGFETLGIYDENTVYIPNEVLEFPEIKNNISLVLIKGMDAQEILDAIINLGSGITLGKETLSDIMTIIKANKYDTYFVEAIKNRELKALLYDHYNMVPLEPVEYLRYVVSKLTGESLLIKNKALIEKIKGIYLNSDIKVLDSLLKKAPIGLASIFYRFKPIFLALKSISNNKSFFNRLRKMARKLHEPMPEDYLNSVTANLKVGRSDLKKLELKLERVSVFRKIRLAYALKYRLDPGDSIIYKVRNGRGWVEEFYWPFSCKEITQQSLDIVLNSIVGDVRKNVEGKVIYIPSNVNYALPATEKQFTGHFPTGSYISVPQDLIVGIHWFNTERKVDLDLSVIGESGKTGWDSSYRSEDFNVLFSGDVTNAPKPKGASELFYIKHVYTEPKILMINYYNFRQGDEVGAKILVAQDSLKYFHKNYMVDVNKIIATANINISHKQSVLGLIVNYGNENRVYFSHSAIGKSITSSKGQHSTYARKYLVKSLVNSLNFKDILVKAGSQIVDVRPEGEYLDLSPDALDKNTIINLVRSV